VAADLSRLVARIGELRADLLAGVRAAPDDTTSADALRRAKRHCEIHAMISCMLTWIHNHAHFGGAFADGAWLVLCLERLLERAQPDTGLSEQYLPSLENVMFRCFDEHRWFSLTAMADEDRWNAVQGPDE
jgi:hypothetical protein